MIEHAVLSAEFTLDKKYTLTIRVEDATIEETAGMVAARYDLPYEAMLQVVECALESFYNSLQIHGKLDMDFFRADQIELPDVKYAEAFEKVIHANVEGLFYGLMNCHYMYAIAHLAEDCSTRASAEHTRLIYSLANAVDNLNTLPEIAATASEAVARATDTPNNTRLIEEMGFTNDEASTALLIGGNVESAITLLLDPVEFKKQTRIHKATAPLLRRDGDIPLRFTYAAVLERLTKWLQPSPIDGVHSPDSHMSESFSIALGAQQKTFFIITLEMCPNIAKWLAPSHTQPVAQYAQIAIDLFSKLRIFAAPLDFIVPSKLELVFGKETAQITRHSSLLHCNAVARVDINHVPRLFLFGADSLLEIIVTHDDPEVAFRAIRAGLLQRCRLLGRTTQENAHVKFLCKSDLHWTLARKYLKRIFRAA